METALSIIVLLGTLSNGPPLPTAEIHKLVEQMGDDSFQVREEASRKLEDLGYEAILALEWAMRHKDPEIRSRANRSLGNYYAVSADDKDNPYPPLWYLPEKYRYTKGGDIAKHYYEDRRRHYNKDNFRSPLSDEDWSNEFITREATVLWVRDNLRKGIKREDMRAILNRTAKHIKTHHLEPGGRYDEKEGRWVDAPFGKMVENPPPPNQPPPAPKWAFPKGIKIPIPIPRLPIDL